MSCDLLIPKKPLCFPFLTEDQLSNLTECELRSMTDIIRPQDPALLELYNTYLNRILNPSGNWVDFNYDYQSYLCFLELINSKIFGDVSIPPAPQPLNYPII